MPKTFRTHSKRRLSMMLWTLVFLLIAAAQVISRQPPLVTILFFLIACIGCRIAWRRVTLPLYTLTDEDIRIGGVLLGDKRIRWQDIKEVKKEDNWMRLVGREWIVGAQINLNHLQPSEQEEFVALVQEHVHRANAS